MLLRRIVLSALLVGLLAGAAFSLMQHFTLETIILASETYEVDTGHQHDHGGEEAWEPQPGSERRGFTLLSNVLAGIGFAAVLLALMSQWQVQGMKPVNAALGMFWGVGGFIAVFLVPALGLPPEIPGMEAAPVAHRQLWWLFAVVSAVCGLFTLVLAPGWWKLLGALLLVLPYVVPIPHPTGPLFAHPDPATLQALEQLHQHFIVASALCNLVFWLALGLLSGVAMQRWVSRGADLVR